MKRTRLEVGEENLAQHHHVHVPISSILKCQSRSCKDWKTYQLNQQTYLCCYSTLMDIVCLSIKMMPLYRQISHLQTQ